MVREFIHNLTLFDQNSQEYIWNYHFYQDGTIEVEIRLTGILSVYVSADGEPSPFGTIVAPNINAHYHQHLFNVRIDPMIDGLNNTVIESDIVPLDKPTGSKDNFAGNGFHVKETLITKETGRPYDHAKDRRWRIVNRSRPHYASGQPAGYSIALKSGALPFLGQPDGWAGKRAGLLENTLWVVRDVENEADGQGSMRMWPAGKYVPQTRDEPEDSIRGWVKGDQKVIDEDLLVFVTFGTTHIPRPEDWPVYILFWFNFGCPASDTPFPDSMPVEHLSLTFKPNSFFKANPSIDVPGSNDSFSVLAFKDPQDPETCTVVQGHACCQ
jgi:primary-amine oxidase